jgi:hypothetical protein
VPAASFAYEPPVIVAVTAGPGGVGTRGGSVITVTGRGFPLPPWPVAVLVGAPAQECVILDSSRTDSTSFQCVVPRGRGTVPLSLHTPGQWVAGAPLVYAPPRISEVLPTDGDRPIEGGFRVTVVGAVRA